VFEKSAPRRWAWTVMDKPLARPSINLGLMDPLRLRAANKRLVFSTVTLSDLADLHALTLEERRRRRRTATHLGGNIGRLARDGRSALGTRGG
jgi:hypothetical protein